MRTASRPRGSDSSRATRGRGVATHDDGLGRAAIALGLALCVGLAGGAHHLSQRPSAPARPKAAVAQVSRQKKAEVKVMASPQAVLPAAGEGAADVPLPRSLGGTDTDGALREDERGALVIDPEVIRLFDYYLSALGEESEEVIRGRVIAAANRLQSPSARAEAIALFDTYTAYRAAGRKLTSSSDDLGDRLSAIRALRREHFGDKADRLFGADERAQAVAVEQRKVALDASLSPEERERRLAALEEGLPEAARKARADAIAPLRHSEEEARRRDEGASDEEIRSFREATLGADAAQRMEELDHQRAAWSARVDSFRAARDAIRASDPDHAEARIEALLEASFSPLERIRVGAIDRMSSL